MKDHASCWGPTLPHASKSHISFLTTSSGTSLCSTSIFTLRLFLLLCCLPRPAYTPISSCYSIQSMITFTYPAILGTRGIIKMPETCTMEPSQHLLVDTPPCNFHACCWFALDSTHKEMLSRSIGYFEKKAYTFENRMLAYYCIWKSWMKSPIQVQGRRNEAFYFFIFTSSTNPYWSLDHFCIS